MPADALVTSNEPTPPAILTHDLLCLRCRYNLRSIAETGACPECGLAVAETLSVIARYPDGPWLRRLRLGLDLAIASQAAGFLLVGAAIPLAATGAVAGDAAMLALGAAVALTPPGLALAGALLFASAEPAHADLRERGIARQCAVALALLWLATLAAASVVDLTGGASTAWLDDASRLVFALAVLIATVGVLAAGQWARHVALRLNHPTLAKATRVVALGAAAVGGSVLVGLTLLALLDYVIPPNDVLVAPLLFVGLFGFLGTLLAFLVFGALTWILMITYRVVITVTLKEVSRPERT